MIPDAWRSISRATVRHPALPRMLNEHSAATTICPCHHPNSPRIETKSYETSRSSRETPQRSVNFRRCPHGCLKDLRDIWYVGFRSCSWRLEPLEGSGIMSTSSQPIRSPGSVVPLRSVELGAARRHFYRWPLVPSRELKRIRQVLLHRASVGDLESGDDSSDSAQALLELVTAELRRRGQTDARSSSPVSPQDQAPTPQREKRGLC
jgi:hypothetical protein